MELNKITLPQMYMIESIRKNGVTDQQLLQQVQTGDVSPWREFNENFDFHDLVTWYEKDPDTFKSVILDGYQVKFVTIYGLKNYLKLKFGKQEDQDFQLTEKGITDLHVDDQQLAKIQQMLSKNWTIQELTSTPCYKVVQIELI